MKTTRQPHTISLIVLTKNFNARAIQHPNRLSDFITLIVRQPIQRVRTRRSQHYSIPFALFSALEHLGEGFQTRNWFQIGEVGFGLQIFGFDTQERVVWVFGNVVGRVIDVDELLGEAILGGEQ